MYSIKMNVKQLVLLDHLLLKDIAFLVIRPVHLVQVCIFVHRVYQDSDYQMMQNVLDYVLILAF